jgi:hypothetical protein
MYQGMYNSSMRFKFESANRTPLGEGKEKRVYADPNNEKRVIAERKESAEKETYRQLKGRYYLTKMVHLLLPETYPIFIKQENRSMASRQ